VFPEVVEATDGASFAAEALAHPLLPADRAVANDVALRSAGSAPARENVAARSMGPAQDAAATAAGQQAAAGRATPSVLVVSGSNMSGKSTLLRSIGVAAVLAQTGAPVCAARLRLSSLTVGASIRVMDSLQEGESRFYAEILRLRAIVERAGQGTAPGAAVHASSAAAPIPRTGAAAPAPDGAPPVLFLIDEFLHGTNSHDRRIGASAIVRGLVERGAIGLITTHDLALTHIADELGAPGANVHFEDHLEGGVMRFDYRLRPGVVEKSNALELMRSVGLEV
jgi:dsDNA-specific endonuclease/ATPase MutS2